MATFVGIVIVLLLGALLLVAAMRPRATTKSRFELERRQKAGDEAAERILHRETLLRDIVSLQRIATALLLVVLTILLVAEAGWFFGIVIAIVVALEYGAVARVAFVQGFSQKAYHKLEPHLLRLTARYPQIFRLIRGIGPEQAPDVQVESREQLLHLVARSGEAVLSGDEKRMVEHMMRFGDQLVADHMTPASVIDSVKHSELLGPLVLDDLHKTGHTRFPVIDGDLDHIVGILHIQDLLTLDTGRQTATVAKAMEPRVFYIRDDQTLKHALAAFLRTHHHLFVVVNEFRETVGLLSLEEVMEALLGHKIVDEFDAHQDLRAVAARNPRGNNDPVEHTDV